MHIKSESVAEHSFFVASIVIALHQYYEFDRERAVIMGLTHDWSEVFITDVPHNVKRNFPDVAAAIKKTEYKVYEEHFPTVAGHFKELEEGLSNEALIVLLADVLSVLQYSTSEIKLGNDGYIREVLEESNRRIETLELQLKDAGVKEK
jgi:5'-deoxynucleotidase YfbR-like HD superfamily hydrolase